MLVESRVQEVREGSSNLEQTFSDYPFSCNDAFEAHSRSASIPDNRPQAVAIETISRECHSYAAILLHLTHDINPDVRAFAVDPLSRSGSPKALDLLLQLLHDGDASVRHAAVVALGNLHDCKAIRPLSALLEREPDEDVILSALDTLAVIGNKTVPGSTLPGLDKDQEVVVETVAEFLSPFKGISGIMPRFNRFSHRLTHERLENYVVQSLLQIADRRKQGNLSDDVREQLTNIFEKVASHNPTRWAAMHAAGALQKLRSTDRFRSHPEPSRRQP